MIIVHQRFGGQANSSERLFQINFGFINLLGYVPCECRNWYHFLTSGCHPYEQLEVVFRHCDTSP